MYYQQVQQINHDIDQTGRAIIALGCSFVQGQGAVNDELYHDYNWHFERVGVPLALKVTAAEQEQILARYPNVSVNHINGALDFTMMEYDNAFCDVLAKKYFQGAYAAINLGIRGCGNRATIKDLYFHPELHWHNLKEIIVIYCPSGPERFDFVNDGWHSHHHWTCMWPHYQDFEPGPRRIMSEGYSKRLYSSKFEVIEQIAHVQELMTWCKLKNARLIVTPAFVRDRYTREYFHESLYSSVGRKMSGEMTKITDMRFFPGDPNSEFLKSELNALIEMFPWDCVFLPDGKPTFADLCLSNEYPDTWRDSHFFTYNGTGSPNHWITSCAHPGAKGHDAFAKELHDHIIKTQ